jgi:hypothetical protein
MVEAGVLVLFPVLADDAGRVGVLLEKYPQMDLGDATLVVLSGRIPRARLITVDPTDFSVYRRKDGTAVPSVMPSACSGGEAHVGGIFNHERHEKHERRRDI